MKNQSSINIKLNGYRPTHRNKWWFIHLGVLKLHELMLLEFYADLMGFDKRNDRWGLITVDFKKIARYFRNSPSSIRSWHNRLLRVGLIKKTATKGIYSLTSHERYINPGKWQGKAAYYVGLEKNQPAEKMFQNFGIISQNTEKNVQPVKQIGNIKLKEQTPIVISSSKVESSIYPKRAVVNQPTRTNEEYQRIYDEGGYKFLTPDDMCWIDENIGAKEDVKSNSLEENVTEVFFKGDWQNYQQHLINKREYCKIN